MNENSEKIRKQAFDQIYSCVNPEKRKKMDKPILSVNNKQLKESVFGNSPNLLSGEDEILSSRYNNTNSNLNDVNNKTKENFENFMKFFKDSCEVNNILTVDQKIDYLVYLRNNTNIKKDNSKIS